MSKPRSDGAVRAPFGRREANPGPSFSTCNASVRSLGVAVKQAGGTVEVEGLTQVSAQMTLAQRRAIWYSFA